MISFPQDRRGDEENLTGVWFSVRLAGAFLDRELVICPLIGRVYIQYTFLCKGEWVMVFSFFNPHPLFCGYFPNIHVRRILWA